MEVHIQAMLENLPFSRGDVAPENSHSGLEKFDRSPIELSFDETMLVAAGEKLPYEDRLLDLRFPPPPEGDPSTAAKPNAMATEGGQGEATRSPSAQKRLEKRRRQRAKRKARQKELEAPVIKESGTSNEESQPADSKESSEPDHGGADQNSPDKSSAKDRTRLLTEGKQFRLDLKRARLRARGELPPAYEYCAITRRELDALARAYCETVLSIPQAAHHLRRRFLAKVGFIGQYAGCLGLEERPRFESAVWKETLVRFLESRKGKDDPSQ